MNRLPCADVQCPNMTPRQACLAVLMASVLLSAQRSATQEQAADLPRFKVAVDAVRIDAVVTDRDGRIVRDLTAADFVVLQNGTRLTLSRGYREKLQERLGKAF